MSEINIQQPHSLEAERGVIGALLIDKDSFLQIGELIKSEDFYDSRNGIVYDACLTLYEKHIPIDLVTITNYLKENNKLDIVGGEVTLTDIATSTPSSSHVFYYATIVKEKSTLRKLAKAGRNIAGYASDGNQEMADILEKSEKELFKVTQTFVKNKLVPIKEILNHRYEEFARLHNMEDKSQVQGTPSGFKALDFTLNGMKGGDMIIIAARPSMGKTTLSLNIAQNVALQYNKTVAFFSFEMSKEQLVDKMFTALLGVDSMKLNKGLLEDEDFSRMGMVMDQLSNAKIFFDDSAGSNASEIKSKCRKLKIEHGLDLIIIDYLQLMSGNSSGNFSGNRVQEITDISRGIKLLAREIDCPIIALSQLNRSVENRPGKIPMMSDLRESGAIEQDADVVMMLYREDYYEEDSERKGMLDLYIRKNRNGPVGRVELMFKKEQGRFFDVERRENNNVVFDDE